MDAPPPGSRAISLECIRQWKSLGEEAMSANLNEIIRELSPAERKRIKDRAAEIIAEEKRKNLDSGDENKVVERGGIGYNSPHLDTEFAKCFAVALEIFHSVFKLDASGLQESVDLHPSLIPKQAPQLRVGDFLSAVGFCCKCFECSSGNVHARRHKGLQ
jgi:hypothetical protein